MRHCASRIGDAYFRTPRTTIKEFVNLMAVLDQNPGVSWPDLIEGVEIQAETNPDLAPIAQDGGTSPSSPEVEATDDNLVHFRL